MEQKESKRIKITLGVVSAIAFLFLISGDDNNEVTAPVTTQSANLVESIGEVEKEQTVEGIVESASVNVILPTNNDSSDKILVPKQEVEAKQSCHPSYSGCLNPNASDYDCAGGSGNGPYYTGTVRVLGPDVFGLDRDKDGLGCE